MPVVIACCAKAVQLGHSYLLGEISLNIDVYLMGGSELSIHLHHHLGPIRKF